MNLPADANITAAYGEYCNGPGWTNTLLHVVYWSGGTRHEALLQPDEWPDRVRDIVDVSALACERLAADVRSMWHNQKGGATMK